MYEVNKWLYKLFNKSKFEKYQSLRVPSEDATYSLSQFDETKSIFVHIPKAAGISVATSLYGGLAAGHASISRYQCIFERSEFEEYFKFTFVRNPWDRTYSAFTFLKQGGVNERDKRWCKKHLERYASFEDFVLNGLNTKAMRRSTHFKSQTSMLCLKGSKEIAVDFVGYFERINEDFDHIARKLGVDAKLQTLNKTDRKAKYIDAYTDEMKAVIAKVYNDDITNFGYDFTNEKLLKSS